MPGTATGTVRDEPSQSSSSSSSQSHNDTDSPSSSPPSSPFTPPSQSLHTSLSTTTARRKISTAAGSPDSGSEHGASNSGAGPDTGADTGAGNPNSIPTALLYQIQIASIDIPQAYITPFCGAAAGAASGIVTCPLDVIKTKLQAQGGFENNNKHGGGGGEKSSRHHHRYRYDGRYATERGMGGGGRESGGGGRLVEWFRKCRADRGGMIGTGQMILKDEGVRGFYRGLAPMLLGYLPTWAVYMTVYDLSRHFLENDGGSISWWLSRMGASVTAGACSTIVTNPIWVIKTRLMSQSLRTSTSTSTSDGTFSTRSYSGPSWGYKGTVDAFIKIYRSEGIRTFYSGLTPALLGLSHVAIQFPLYEFFKMQFTGYEIGEAPPDQNGVVSNTHWVGISAATFLSKVCASTITYPHEVLRTRMQTQQRYMPPGRFGEHGISLSDPRYDTHRESSPGQRQRHHQQQQKKSRGQTTTTTTTAASSSDGMPNRPRYHGVLQSCKTILREEGWRAFYSGIGTNLFRAIPSAMTTMLTYEYLKGVIGWMQREGEGRLLEMEKMDA